MRRVPTRSRQSGVVLIVALIMLLLLTLIGVTGMQTTNLEEKMAANAKEQNIAFQVAESALLDAEAYVLANPVSIYNGANGLLNTGDAEPDFFASATWQGTASRTTANNFATNLGLPAGTQYLPRYVIKKIANIPASGSDPAKTVFRITARAIGNNPGTQVILQSIYERTS